MKIHFGEWDDELHETNEQQERLKKAASSKTSPQYVDVYEESAEFEGSGKKPCRTSLISCTCGDFIHRHLPCKHIYRLAMELGIIDVKFEYGRNKNNIINRIKYFSTDGRNLLLKVMQSDGYLVTCSKCTDELIINGFCCEIIRKNQKSPRVITLEALPEVDEVRFQLLKELKKEIKEEQNNVPNNV